MPTDKPKSIKTIGIILIALSCFIIFGNSMGFLAMKVLMSQGALGNDTFFSRFKEIAATGIFIGIGFFISGIGITKYRTWGRWLGTFVAVVSICAIWRLMVFMRNETDQLGAFANFPIAVAAFWTILQGLMIYFLNRKITFSNRY